MRRGPARPGSCGGQVTPTRSATSGQTSAPAVGGSAAAASTTPSTNARLMDPILSREAAAPPHDPVKPQERRGRQDQAHGGATGVTCRSVLIVVGLGSERARLAGHRERPAPSRAREGAQAGGVGARVGPLVAARLAGEVVARGRIHRKRVEARRRRRPRVVGAGGRSTSRRVASSARRGWAGGAASIRVTSRFKVEGGARAGRRKEARSQRQRQSCGCGPDDARELRGLESWAPHEPAEQPVPQGAVAAAGRSCAELRRTRAPRRRRARARLSNRRPRRRSQGLASWLLRFASFATGATKVRRRPAARLRGRWHPAPAGARRRRRRGGAEGGAAPSRGRPLGDEGERVSAAGQVSGNRRAAPAGGTSASGVPGVAAGDERLLPAHHHEPAPAEDVACRMSSRYFFEAVRLSVEILRTTASKLGRRSRNPPARRPGRG